MPYKNPEAKRAYHRDYMRRRADVKPGNEIVLSPSPPPGRPPHGALIRPGPIPWRAVTPGPLTWCKRVFGLTPGPGRWWGRPVEKQGENHGI